MATKPKRKETQPTKTKTKGPVLHLDTKGKNLLIQVKNQDRLTQHGFGVFLEKIKKGEITITKGAMAMLERGKYRSGVQAVEFLGGEPPVMAFVATQPLWENVSVHEGAIDWLKELATVVD